MSAPKKNIPEVVGQRMLELSLQGYGARRISKMVASEYGSENKYSHTYIQNFLNDHASVANTFQQNETSIHTVNPEPIVEQTPLATELHVPQPHVTLHTYAPVSPSTLVVPYPVPQEPAPPGDSMEQVFLDLMRAKGLAAIQHQYQQREAPVQPTENKDLNRFERLIEEVRSYKEQQEKKEQEEMVKILEASKSEWNEHLKRMEAISNTTGTGTETPADRTPESESNVKGVEENNQPARNETTSTHQDTQAVLTIDKKEADSTAATPSTVKRLELASTTINDSKKLPDSHGQARQADPFATTGSVSATSPPPILDPSITVTLVRNDGFSQQPKSIEPETHTIQEPDQRSVANIPEYAPPTPTEQKGQIPFQRIPVAQDVAGSHTEDAGSSTSQLLTIVGLGLGALGIVFGIDYLKARANSTSSKVKTNTSEQLASVRGYSRVNDPNGTATF